MKSTAGHVGSETQYLTMKLAATEKRMKDIEAQLWDVTLMLTSLLENHNQNVSAEMLMEYGRERLQS